MSRPKTKNEIKYRRAERMRSTDDLSHVCRGLRNPVVSWPLRRQIANPLRTHREKVNCVQLSPQISVKDMMSKAVTMVEGRIKFEGCAGRNWGLAEDRWWGWERRDHRELAGWDGLQVGKSSREYQCLVSVLMAAPSMGVMGEK